VADYIIRAKVGDQWVKSKPVKLVVKALLNARWSEEQAAPGDEVQLLVDAPGFADGTAIGLEIFERDDGDDDDSVKKLTAAVAAGKVEATYKVEEITDDDDPRGGPPELYFVATEGDDFADQSDLLLVRSWFRVTVTDDDGDPVVGEPYMVTFSDGSTRRGVTNARGEAWLGDVPPGKYTFHLLGHYRLEGDGPPGAEFGEGAEGGWESTFEDEDDDAPTAAQAAEDYGMASHGEIEDEDDVDDGDDEPAEGAHPEPGGDDGFALTAEGVEAAFDEAEDDFSDAAEEGGGTLWEWDDEDDLEGGAAEDEAEGDDPFTADYGDEEDGDPSGAAPGGGQGAPATGGV
jgi:hypothetical protein